MEYNLTVKDILEITKGNLICGSKSDVCCNFSKDTKTIKEGDTFIGFKGEKNDGGNFYKQALLAGAKGCIINKNINERIEIIPGKFIIEVEDTVLATQLIAKYKRSKYNIPVIAVTGSVGKTSTKDMIGSVVGQKYNVLKTQGNMNNHIGLPMTILGLKRHTAMVVEMGMNHFGEIRTLTNIAKPTIAIITNIGTAHIGNLGSQENILKAKLEIIEGLASDGKIVINNDDTLLHKWYLENNDKFNIVTYGIENKSDIMAKNIEYNQVGSKYTLVESNNEITINVPIGGKAFVYNSLAANSVGNILKIDNKKMKKGIEDFELTKMRLDIQKTDKGYAIINDCYNANYDSMKSAIEFLKNSKGNRKIAILGDMLELGEYSRELHEKVGEVVANNKIDILITVGKESKNISRVAQKGDVETYEFINNEEAIVKIREIIKPGDNILIKASNSMNFKEIVSALL